MSRQADSIGMGYSYPGVGPHNCFCTGVKKDVSKNENHTPFIEIEWTANTGEMFTDKVFTTPKAIGRLTMVAMRCAGLDRKAELPDSDSDCVTELERFIMENIVGKEAIVTIEEQEYEFMPTEGSDIGKKIKKKNKRVAFRGYDEVKQSETKSDPSAKKSQDEDLPF